MRTWNCFATVLFRWKHANGCCGRNAIQMLVWAFCFYFKPRHARNWSWGARSRRRRRRGGRTCGGGVPQKRRGLGSELCPLSKKFWHFKVEMARFRGLLENFGILDSWKILLFFMTITVMKYTRNACRLQSHGDWLACDKGPYLLLIAVCFYISLTRN